MKYVIGLNPSRRVNRASNRGVAKYAQTRRDGKFKWVTNADEATVFPTFQAALASYGNRCTLLRGRPTSDVIFIEVTERAPVPATRVVLGRVHNGY